jgi:hypothetical protein
MQTEFDSENGQHKKNCARQIISDPSPQTGIHAYASRIMLMRDFCRAKIRKMKYENSAAHWKKTNI